MQAISKLLTLTLLFAVGSSVASADDGAEVRSFLSREITSDAQAARSSAEEGEVLMKRRGPSSKYYCAVGFRTGTLWRDAQMPTKAQALYQTILAKANPSDAQRPILWMTFAAVLAPTNPRRALEAYRRALTDRRHLSPEVRSRLGTAIEELELSAGTREQRQSQIAKIVSLIKAGRRDGDLPARLQLAYKACPEFAPKLSKAVFARLANGRDRSDFDLAVAALSSDLRASEPTTRIAVPYVEEVTRRLSAGAKGAALLLQGQWAMALWDDARDRNAKRRALLFAADAVRGLKPPFDPREKEDAVILVHHLESVSQPSDRKAQRLIRDALANLNVPSIIREHPSGAEKGPTNRSLGLLVLVASGVIFRASQVWLILTFRRRKLAKR
ncbi:MAG: hypothetical protein C4320_05390 [Armatimonadota bacterium]